MLKIVKLLLLIITVFVLCTSMQFNLSPGDWYRQYLPNLNGRRLTDINFVNSSTGYGVSNLIVGDEIKIIKTTNSGDNWSYISLGENSIYMVYPYIRFLNDSIGYIACGKLKKTTNAGLNWFNVNTSGHFANNMYVLNEDSIWIVYNDNIDTGVSTGIYRTTNGGINWSKQSYGFGAYNPNNIYMFNGRIGFVDGGNSGLRKTSNSGESWISILGAGNFNYIYFIDSINGWKCYNSDFKKTTNGGFDWITQNLPSGGYISGHHFQNFKFKGRDTIIGVSGSMNYGNGQFANFIYRTTNAGENWYYQVLDSADYNGNLLFVEYIEPNNWWVYGGTSGFHTTTGGEPIGISQISNQTPINYFLQQNYPNPFNPFTNIKFEIPQRSNVKISIYDILGKEISVLVNEVMNPGTFEVNWDGSNFPSGVYFYKIVTDKFSESKKMVLVK